MMLGSETPAKVGDDVTATVRSAAVQRGGGDLKVNVEVRNSSGDPVPTPEIGLMCAGSDELGRAEYGSGHQEGEDIPGGKSVALEVVLSPPASTSGLRCEAPAFVVLSPLPRSRYGMSPPRTRVAVDDQALMLING